MGKRGRSGNRGRGPGQKLSPDQVRAVLGAGNKVDLSKGVVINPEAAKFQFIQGRVNHLSQFIHPAICSFMDTHGRVPTAEESREICRQVAVLAEVMNTEFDAIVRSMLDKWEAEHEGGPDKSGPDEEKPKSSIIQL